MHIHPPWYQNGSTLIEVLIAMLLLAVGLLGMAGLQTLSLRTTHDAYLRTQATILAADGAERMRAGAQGSGTLSADELAAWQQAVATTLPLGSGEVCRDATPDDGTVVAPACDGAGALHAVKVWWDADRNGESESRLAMGFRLW